MGLLGFFNRKSGSNGLDNDEKWVEIARTSSNSKDYFLAVSRITNPQTLKMIVEDSVNFKQPVRLLAIQRITDQKFLIELALNNIDDYSNGVSPIAKHACDRIEIDKEFFSNLAMLSSDTDKMISVAVLCLSRNHPDYPELKKALKYLHDVKLIENIRNATNVDKRFRYICNIRLNEIAENKKNELAKKEKRIKTALEHESEDCRRNAVFDITDRASLETVFDKSTDVSIRWCVAKRLGDEERVKEVESPLDIRHTHNGHTTYVIESRDWEYYHEKCLCCGAEYIVKEDSETRRHYGDLLNRRCRIIKPIISNKSVT